MRPLYIFLVLASSTACCDPKWSVGDCVVHRQENFSDEWEKDKIDRDVRIDELGSESYRTTERFRYNGDLISSYIKYSWQDFYNRSECPKELRLK